MADKSSNKFPYIVLPNLSEDQPATSVPKPKSTSTRKVRAINNSSPHQKTESGQDVPVKLPPINNQRPTDPLSPRSLTSSKALNRHLALSKQFAMSSHSKSIKEIQATQRKILMAHYEMRKSPRSLYPSGTTSETSVPYLCNDQIKIPTTVSFTSVETQLQNENVQSRKASLEALAQIFPHRIYNTVQNTIAVKNERNFNSSCSEDDLKTSEKKVQQKISKPEVSKNLSISHRTVPLCGAGDPESLSEDQFKSRLDGLTVHVKSRDEEISQLKQDLIDLQLLVLKEKKETEKSSSLARALQHEISTLERKQCLLEKTISTQEKNIIDKLLLLDGMESLSDTDSEYERIESKPSAWVCSNSNGCKKAAKSQSGQGTGVGVLKECLNWVPVAPDFDKLLNIIGLLNFRMDRNQSMKLCRKGNEASFKHADTINLTLYKNGLTLGKCGFRSYATLSVIKLINEMFNGYFPTELHSQYPDGVIFVVTDKRSVYHDLNAGFYGPGVKLSDSKSPPILIPGAEKFSIVKKFNDAPAQLAQETLSCTSVTSNLTASSSTSYCSLPDLPTLNEISNSYISGNKMIILKLKNSATGKVYKLKTSIVSSIKEIAAHLEKHLENISTGTSPEENSTKYDLVLPVPYGILTSGTLKDYGMVQNTLLYIQPRT